MGVSHYSANQVKKTIQPSFLEVLPMTAFSQARALHSMAYHLSNSFQLPPLKPKPKRMGHSHLDVNHQPVTIHLV
jgi:hypothetical protein